jgi:hypothetical protein
MVMGMIGLLTEELTAGLSEGFLHEGTDGIALHNTSQRINRSTPDRANEGKPEVVIMCVCLSVLLH